MLILRQELGGGCAKAVLARLTEEMRVPGLGHASREQCLRLDAVFGTGALANTFAVDDLVDVPDAATQEQSWRSSLVRRHDGPQSHCKDPTIASIATAGKPLFPVRSGRYGGGDWLCQIGRRPTRGMYRLPSPQVGASQGNRARHPCRGRHLNSVHQHGKIKILLLYLRPVRRVTRELCGTCARRTKVHLQQNFAVHYFD